MNKYIKNFLIIFALGISSGLPFALISSTLKALLVDAGFTIKTIGFLSLATLPYSLKFLIAPFIDSLPIPFLTKKIGHRKSWIIFSQLLLAIFIFLLGIFGIESSLMAITIFAFLVAISSSAQDIVIDGYRIELINKNDQGLATSFYVYGYRIGILISGSLALFLADKISWTLVYLIMSLFMASCMIATVLAKETRTNWKNKKTNFLEWFKNFVLDPFYNFSENKGWYLILLFIISFKLADAFAGNLTAPFLLEIGYSKTELAGILKTFGLFATLLGVFFGGVFTKKFNILPTLWLATIIQGLSNLSFAYLAKIGYNIDLLYVVVFIENFSGGIGDAVFVAYLSSICNLNFSATQYALLSSLASFARGILSSSAGIYAEYFGWFKFFIFSGLLAIPGILFLLILTIKKFQKRNS
jgi:PAT family beta-lactamase induction signal transducer AmpG